MHRYKLTVAYDGTQYCGWQVQNTGTSIQPLIQRALETALRHPIALSGSGRTDSGVHARGQVAHFDTSTSFDPQRLLLSLNALLPEDIRILTIEPAADTFHARYSAKQKTYHYHLHLDRVAIPTLAPYRYHLFGKIDREKLASNTKHFTGTRDFTSFANDATRGCAAHDPIRTLTRFDCIEQRGGVRFELEADGFLYKMVRNLVGTLIDLTRGKFAPDQMDAIFAAKDRRAAGSAAPPQGLFLMHVDY